MDDGADGRSKKIARSNRDMVKQIPDWIQWFLGMTLPPSLMELYEPVGSLRSVSPSIPDADSHLAVVVGQLCKRLGDDVNTVPVRWLACSSVRFLKPCLL